LIASAPESPSMNASPAKDGVVLIGTTLGHYHILEKLGVHSRAQAVSVAYNEGLRPANGSPVD